ncbi:helix-hairpin-helix domain-containing protein [Micropruina sp.]|uniref:helix-hairpin-helix domain-containing protein n=1 Tax=Micropruina sp. TaxID=2737536 RepID=UPI0039E306E1
MERRARLAADDELSQIVRRRLQSLLAEIPPRRATEPVVEFERSNVPSHDGAEPDRAVGEDLADGLGGDDGWAGWLPQDEPISAGRTGRYGTDSTVSPSSAGDAGNDRAVPRHELLGTGTAARVAKGKGRVSALPPGLGLRARQFVREHLVVVGIVVLTGCLWGGYSLLQAKTTPVAMAATEPSVQVSVAAPAPSASATLLVHVLGEVRRPGVVSLPEDARVQDAITAAGGFTDRAVPGQLNLAARVSDGAQLVIGRKGSQVNAATAPGSTSASDATIDLNTATSEQLDTLPGVGPVTAQKILSWREQHGRFRAVAELQEVDGIGPKSYAEIAPHVRV